MTDKDRIKELEDALKLIARARVQIKRVSRGELWCRSVAEKALNT